ncbi:ABC transporter permease [Streptomyces sp. NPDC093085]|uniref:ABC transporter permease n=1 Tax=Streptomyces sp. NPDC093085 TaxID=3155068 RepID=UPI003431CC05
MSITAPAAPSDTVTDRAPRDVDNRSAYIAFGLAYVLGHGAAALSKVTEGGVPLLDLPGWLPMALLGTGLASGSLLATLAALRSQRGATGPAAVTAQLLGAAWAVAFGALFLFITGLSGILDNPDLQTMLWPTGSGFVVGLLYVAEGAVRRNRLHYTLGIWLALTTTGALLFGTPGFYWVLTLAGGGAYALAAGLEFRRIATA